MVGSLCGLLAGNTLGAQTLSMSKPFVTGEKWSKCFFFLRVDMWKKRRLKLGTSFPLL